MSGLCRFRYVSFRIFSFQLFLTMISDVCSGGEHTRNQDFEAEIEELLTGLDRALMSLKESGPSPSKPNNNLEVDHEVEETGSENIKCEYFDISSESYPNNISPACICI